MSEPTTAAQAAPVESDVRLTITAGPHAGEFRTFGECETLVAGRAPDCQWRLEKDRHFSRYHFRVVVDPLGCSLTDLESSNGTLVRGQRIRQADLHDGDQIHCGDTRFDVTIRRCPPTSAGDPAVERHDAYRTVEHRITDGPLFAGMELADYDVTREIGRGAMGVVYRAIHRPSRREVALKVILQTGSLRSDAVQMFLREANLLSRLRHRRIVECLEIGIHEGCFYFAMEYVPTVDLPSILAKLEPAVRMRTACGIICRVLEGLRFAHEQQIVHRDIKPANILVFRKERHLSAKLADFGLAKNYEHAGLSILSDENQVKGTLPFMPPEQIINCRYAKPACDIYAVGASLYYMLSGRYAFDFGESRSVAALILNSEPVAIERRVPEITQELSAVIRRSMAREPGDRFATAEEMRKAILPLTRGGAQ